MGLMFGQFHFLLYLCSKNKNLNMNTKDRTINFGKYKGTPIKQLILEHIGYVYWCLGNLN